MTGQPICLYCERDSAHVPLLKLIYRGEDVWICPQHFPVLIHKPAELADKLPGAEHFGSPGRLEYEHTIDK